MARSIVYMYAIGTACFAAVVTSAAYAIGGNAYYKGWTIQRTISEIAVVDDRMIEMLSSNVAGPVLLAIYGPILAMLETLLVGGVKLGHMTHSIIFAQLLALCVVFVPGVYGGMLLYRAFGGKD